MRSDSEGTSFPGENTGTRRRKSCAEDFAHRILLFDERAAKMFGPIAVARRVHGRPIGVLDAQIAAIARAHGATLATRNTYVFEGCGVRLVNPWEG